PIACPSMTRPRTLTMSPTFASTVMPMPVMLPAVTTMLASPTPSLVMFTDLLMVSSRPKSIGVSTLTSPPAMTLSCACCRPRHGALTAPQVGLSTPLLATQTLTGAAAAGAALTSASRAPDAASDSADVVACFDMVHLPVFRAAVGGMRPFHKGGCPAARDAHAGAASNRLTDLLLAI